ncbi:hypothetical protein HDE_11641 [Halotydeus destructor]|nr:hypothetical protein HDE_11641 [Halotydeus destructor]
MSSEDVYEVEDIVKERVVSKKGRRTIQYLIKWKDFDDSHNEWIPACDVGRQAIKEWKENKEKLDLEVEQLRAEPKKRGRKRKASQNGSKLEEVEEVAEEPKLDDGDETSSPEAKRSKSNENCSPAVTKDDVNKPSEKVSQQMVISKKDDSTQTNSSIVYSSTISIVKHFAQVFLNLSSLNPFAKNYYHDSDLD